MNKTTKKQIEGAFYAYEVLKESTRTELQDLAESGLAVKYDTVRVAGGINSSKVENAVLKISDNARWCLVVENTLIRYRHSIERELILAKYIQKWDDVRIYTYFHTPRSTYYFLLNNILREAEQFAMDYRLIV